VSIQTRVLEALRWTTATRFAGYLLTWAINLFVIRLLAPADYGLMALGMAWTGFVEILGSFGQRTMLVQRPALDDSLARRVLGALLLWNVVLVGAVMAAAPALAAFYGDDRLVPIVRWLALAMGIASLGVVPMGLRWREIDFQAVSLVGLAQAISASLIVLALALRGHGVWSLLAGQVGGSLIHTAGILWVTRFPLRPDFRVRGLGAELRFGALVVARTVVSFFDRQVDAILIGKLLGSVPLGAYSVAGSVAKQPGHALLQPIQRVAAPAFARIQGDPERIRRYTLRSMEAIAFVFVPLLWGIGVVADDLVRFVMGERWVAAIPLLQVLCVLLPFRSPMRILPAILDGLGRPDVSLRNVLTTAACVPVGVVIGAQGGILGATLGWSLAQVVAIAINLRRVLPVVGVDFGAVAAVWARTLACGLAMAGVVLAARAAAPASLEPMARLPLAVGLGVATYAAASWALQRELVMRLFRLARGDRLDAGGGTPSASA
jgi:O-antigen/teichoic acid export membrane protein